MKTYRIPVLTVYEEFYVVEAESPEHALKMFNGDDDCMTPESFEDESNPMRLLSSLDFENMDLANILGCDYLYIPQEVKRNG